LRYHGELPGKVDRVLHADIHALTACRAMDMGGVTGEKDLVLPVA
jgi:hypothetical protein